MQKIYYSFISFITIITLFTVLLFYSNGNYIFVSNSFYWPTPNYHNISSYFGNRSRPTVGASTYHNGIDILALQGSNVYAIDDGYVIFAGFNLASGYTIKIQHLNNLVSIYSHLSQNMLVDINKYVNRGEKIATVGPKILADGRTNGATTGPHLHFAIQKNGNYVDPLNFF